jgi:hypothetical protein
MDSPLGTAFSRVDALKRQLYDMLTNPRDAAAMLGGRIVESGQQAQALQEQTFGDPNRPFRVTDPQAMAKLTDMLMAGPMGFAPAGITAYHGSPYLFRQFDPTKVGTGEGAQAYGVGAGYTAEARPVAEAYRLLTAGRNRQVTGDDAQDLASFAMVQGGTKDKAIKYLEKDVKEYKEKGWPNDSYEQLYQNAIERLKTTEMQPEGYLYKGDIPDEILPKFLDWDKPLSQQTPDSFKILKNLLNSKLKKELKSMQQLSKKYGDNFDVESLSGRQVYSILADHFKNEAQKSNEMTGDAYTYGQQKASEYLNSMGIRGIRYLDQGSRGTSGQGTSNFIPFSPEDFKIQEINDIPVEDWISKGLL